MKGSKAAKGSCGSSVWPLAVAEAKNCFSDGYINGLRSTTLCLLKPVRLLRHERPIGGRYSGPASQLASHKLGTVQDPFTKHAFSLQCHLQLRSTSRSLLSPCDFWEA